MRPREFLIFRLWGPMASWGDIAVGERRGSWGRPSRSAVLGLVAAALGLERLDAEAHRRLDAELGFAIRIDHPGKPLRDYHTAQSPSQRRGKRWATRRDELSDPENCNTILSERSYYIQMDALLALWQRGPDARFPLREIAPRLAEPVFTLYLGRKVCPLGLPPAARIVHADSLDAAVQDYIAASAEAMSKLGDYAPKRPSRHHDAALWLSEQDARALGLENRIRQRTQRRDGIRDRVRWLFDDRTEVEIAQVSSW
jgi:CRISPR system Cascade subunit CasD